MLMYTVEKSFWLIQHKICLLMRRVNKTEWDYFVFLFVKLISTEFSKHTLIIALTA